MPTLGVVISGYKQKERYAVGKMNDLALQLEEAGIPDFVYQEAAIDDALRLLGRDDAIVEQANGKWVVVNE